MSDFIAFSEEIDEGMEFLEHHGILNQKWGHRNGPPYPLDANKHSSAEKSAAKAAGVKIGKSSGKGSIDKINKGSKPEVKIMKGGEQTKSKPKKEMTDEEKREAALKAVRDGDKKKITKYMDYLTTDELREAQARSQMKDSLSKKDPDEMTKSERDKMDAMLSGDKQKVREYADKMTTDELRSAMNKVNLMQELNYEPPPPSAMDKLDKFMTNVDRVRVNTEKAINAYNVAAKIYNSTPGHEGKWPIIGGGDNKDKKEKTDQEKAIEALAKQMSKDVSREAKKTLEEQAAEDLRRQKLAYKNQKKLEKYADKLDEKYDKGKKQAESNDQNQGQNNQPKPSQQTQQPAYQNPQPSPQPAQQQTTSNVNRAPKINNVTFNTKPQQDVKYERKEGEGEDARYYYAEKAPKVSNAKFNTKQTQEPTSEQKQMMETYRKSDQQYLNQMKNLSTKKVSDYNDVSYDDLMDSYKDTMRQSYKQAEQRAKTYNEDYYDGLYDWMNQD